jgi:O-antigen ligase
MKAKWLIIILAYVTVLNGLKFSAGPLSIRIEQLVVLICWLIFLFWFLLSKKRFEKFEFGKPARVLVLFWLTLLLSTLLHAPDLHYSLIQSVNLILVSFSFLLMSTYARTETAIQKYLKHSFNATIFVSLIGTLLFFISFLTGHALYGINLVQNENDAFGIYFTMVEPNLYGCYMMIFFFLALSLFTEKTYESWGISRSKVAWVLVCAALGVLLSFTRGVWLATIIGMALFYFNSFKKFFANIRKVFIIVLFAALGLFFLKYVLKLSIIDYKLGNFFSTDVGTGEGRLIIWGMAIENWIEAKNWLIGNGTYSFASFFNTDSYDASTNAWIGNLPLTILHDSGLIGFAIFLIFIVSLVKRTQLLSSEKNSQGAHHLLIGTRLAIIGTMIEFFFSSGLNLSYCWILFGFSTGLSDYIQKRRKPVVIKSADFANNNVANEDIKRS